MKRKASEAMEYFAAATQQQSSNTYKPLPAALLTLSAPPSSAANPSSASRSPASSGASTSSIPSFLTELLPSSALAAYPSKLHNKFLQLAAAQPTSAAAAQSAPAAQTARRQQQQQGQKKGSRGGRKSQRGAKPLTARQRKDLKLLSLPQPPTPELRYANFLPLHALWLAYIRDLLAQPHSSLPLSAGERLLKADYHGAAVTVARSTAPSCVHVSGIVVQESQSGWRIIGEDDRVRLVRKEGTVLTLSIGGLDGDDQQHTGGGWHVELYGDQLAVRSAERAAKKFKGKSSIQLNG